MEADIAGFITFGLVTAFVAGQIFQDLAHLFGAEDPCARRSRAG